jgi:hypothetical protein
VEMLVTMHASRFLRRIAGGEGKDIHFPWPLGGVGGVFLERVSSLQGPMNSGSSQVPSLGQSPPPHAERVRRRKTRERALMVRRSFLMMLPVLSL